jgi:hypothetical protein
LALLPVWPQLLDLRAAYVVREKGNELLAKNFLDHLVFSSILLSLNAAIQLYLQPVQPNKGRYVEVKHI